jgi:hypothetical protein
MGRVEKILFACLVAMLAGVTAVGAYVVVDRATRCGRFHFHATEWRDPRGHRNEMANRLVQCHRLVGVREDELHAQLGKPLERSRERDGTVTWTYDAGADEGLIFLTNQTLLIDVSRQGVVSRARIFDETAD